MNLYEPATLAKLNSLTKYPSIPTLHVMGERGRLTDEVGVRFEPGDTLCVTEKIDGTNSRIIVLPTAILIGSREELLHHLGDVVWNPSQQIVETLLPVARRVNGYYRNLNGITVIFGEVYGGKTSAGAKNYGRSTAFRIFDVMKMPLDEVDAMLCNPIDEIAAWRDGGNQPFVGVDDIRDMAATLGVETVPSREVFEWQRGVAWNHQDAYDFICQWQGTACSLKEPSPNPFDGVGRAEGVVIRTPDRRKIAKLRFEDYERTMRGRR